jgi:hypothetical protein
MFSSNGGVPRRTRRGVGATLRGGGVLGRGALVGVLATGAASRTTLSERRRQLVISAQMLLASVHPSWQYLLLDPGIG